MKAEEQELEEKQQQQLRTAVADEAAASVPLRFCRKALGRQPWSQGDPVAYGNKGKRILLRDKLSTP